MSKSDFHKISLDDLQLGNPIPYDIYDGNEKLLVRKGFVPQSERQLESLIQRGLFASVDEYQKARDPKFVPAVAEAKEQHHVLSMLGKAHGIIQSITLGVVAHAPLPDSPAEVLKAVGILEQAFSLNPDITLACILFKQAAVGYTNRHLMDAAILSMAVSRSMKKSPEEIGSITAAALTMNLGMLRLQEDLHNRAEPPTDEEKLHIRKHTLVSVELLQEAGVTDPDWLSFVLHHHENMDGSGYPGGKAGEDIPEGARIIALADRYTAMIAPRKFRKAMHPSQALRTMLIDGGKTCDAMIAAHFVKELGIYPPGSTVRLVNNELAVVMRKGLSAMSPAVQSFRGPNGADLPYPYKRDTSAESYAIKEGVNLEPADIQFNMQQLWGGEAT